MFRKVDIIFSVEHKDRELDSYKIIARKLSKDYGLKTLIISNAFHRHYFWLYRAKVYVFNNINVNTKWPNNFLWDAFEDNVIYLSHKWDQLLFPVYEEMFRPRTDFAKNTVKYIVWSEYFKNYLIKHGVKSSNINITKKISFEFLNAYVKKNSIKYRIKLSEEFNFPKDKKLLFIPINYLWAFFTDKNVEHRISLGMPKELAQKFRRYTKLSLKKFIKFCLKLSSNKDLVLIIRPHPSITERDYIEKFHQFTNKIPNNIIFNKAYSIKEWITASDIIGSSWSTAVWDSYNVGKKSFYFTPLPRYSWLDTYWLKQVPNIKNIIEFYNILNETKSQKDQLNDEDDSALQFCDLLVKNVKEAKNVKIKKINLIYITYFFKFFIKNLLCKYFNFLFINKKIINDWFDVIKDGKY